MSDRDRATGVGGNAELSEAPKIISREEMQARAGIALASLRRARDLAIDQSFSASRWIIATLATVNGGGALATINFAPKLDHPVLPAVLFTAGLLCTMLNGVGIQHIAERVIGPLDEMLLFWTGVEKSGSMGPDTQPTGLAAYNRAHRWGLVAPAIGWIGGLLFLAGAYSLASAAGRGDPANDRRCLALQRDMLSAHPRKPDGPALFQAFGCRPQGEGSVMVAPARRG